jgi:hypothetical protein
VRLKNGKNALGNQSLDEIERSFIRINIDKGHRRCPKQRILSNVILKTFLEKE